MTSFRKAIVAGVCALGVAVGAMPAQAASAAASAPASIAGVKFDQIQQVDYRGGRRYGGRGWGGGRSYHRGRHYGGRRYYGGRRNYGGYAAAGIAGLAAGALIAGSNRGYYDDGYYAPRRAYYAGPRYRRARCEVVRTRYNAYGERVRVISYRPC